MLKCITLFILLGLFAIAKEAIVYPFKGTQTIPLSKTTFKPQTKHSSKIVNLTGKNFIVPSHASQNYAL
ncbi:MAG: hypothetical protein Q9M36_08815 [Sulfurovum sp.]|nr:hypothetical protein [Sulfurovum sp.]